MKQKQRSTSIVGLACMAFVAITAIVWLGLASAVWWREFPPSMEEKKERRHFFD